MKFLVIGLGGFVGANLRYLLAMWLGGGRFPWGTLAANLIGCFGLALFAVYTGEVLGKVSDEVRLLVGTGFFGALTTFSTFNFEALTLYESGRSATAILYVVVSLVGGIVAGLLGMALARGV